MANFALTHFVFLSLAYHGLARNVDDLSGPGTPRQIQQERPQVVEIIRWRQPVCLTSAPGVLPCMVSLQNAGSFYPENQHHSNGYPQQNRKVEAVAETVDDKLAKKLTLDDSAIDSSSLESIEKEDDDLISKRSPRSVPTPKLYSPNVVESVELENLGASSLREPVAKNLRRKRYLRFAGLLGRSDAARPTYVTRVVDSPIVATLVATTCLPDIGIPLCDERDATHRPGHSQIPPSNNHGLQSNGNYPHPNPTNYPSSYPTHGNNPQYPTNYPAYGNVNNYPSYYPTNGNIPNYQTGYPNHGSSPNYPAYGGGSPNYPINYPGYGNSPNYPPYYPTNGNPSNHPANSSTNGNGGSNNNNGQQQGPQFPGFIQNIADFITQPNTVQANQTPEVKPVVVVQPTSPPGFFDGINAFLMPNGSWFGVFGGNAPGAIQLPQFPQLPQLPPLPQVPTLQQFLYRPENDISETPAIFNVFNLTNNQHPPGAGPPTQSPGIFGSMFASPTGPQGANNPVTTTTTTTTTAAPSIFDGIGSLFRPTSRPLVIESPNQDPIVIERPVYVAEQPVIPGIFDILQFPNRPVRLNSSVDPQVISDPVYVLQQPGQGPFGGLLPNFNLFGTPSTTPSTTTSTTSTTTSPAASGNNNHENYYPPQQYGNTPPGYNGAANAPINPQHPAYPNPPNVIPGYPNVHPNQQPYGYSKSTGIVASEGYAVPVATDVTSTPDSLYAGTNSEESYTTPETDLLDGSLTEIVDVEGETDTDRTTDGTYTGEDLAGMDLLDRDETRQESPNIGDPGIAEEVDNEA